MKKWQRHLIDWASSPLIDAPQVRLSLLDRAASTAAIARVLGVDRKAVLIVTADERDADLLSDALKTYLYCLNDPREIVTVPTVVSDQRRHWQPENEAARCAAFHAAASGKDLVFICSAQSLLVPSPPPALFEAQTFTIRVGDTAWSPESLADSLVSLDYDNEHEVTIPGEFARRGGILDLFSPIYPWPVRIEFFGNQVESMRYFNPETQRSLEALDQVCVIPRGELAAVQQENSDSNFLTYLSENTPLIMVEPEDIRDHLRRFGGQAEQQAFAALMQSQRTIRQVTSWPEPGAAGACLELSCRGLQDSLALIPPELEETAGGQWHWNQLASQLLNWHAAGYTLAAFAGSEGEAERFRERCLQEPGIRKLPIHLDSMPLDGGVILPEARLVLLSERELFGRHPSLSRVRKARYQHELRPREESELEEGQYAVHASHGLCLYHGIGKIEVSGQIQEVIELEFADEARLFVPLEQAHLVSRYAGGTRKLPTLNRLGGSAWKKAKASAAEAAWDMAAELLRFDAIRQHGQGFSFQKHADWENAFADSFPFRATEDQERAIGEVIADMEAVQPMDRLLCGDVGYGKTEVAMRAAFRAVMNGKQVAVLVPTTVLAQQHFITFCERMTEYPITIDMLSRFRTRSEQNKIMERLASGGIDIVIGTHQLLQGSINFRDLGLVVIDEEQRFGVMHKEKFKRLRSTVDILTMTATPIPRTLYFSISGIRHLSTISTPPEERLPVNTIVALYDDDLIRQAILRELARKGQAFFLHNRVRSIEATCEKLKELVPEARFVVAHGQMSPHELEERMLHFLDGKADVLVCTTIIESGLDIRNANTILIDRADRFGLAELYQLRGRVGRYHHQAYAYLLLPPMGNMPRNARERLAAIRRYTHLGAGFKLALRDLEIRGAGNILGTSQSGHIAAVGFELYCELLRESVHRLENREAPPQRQTVVQLEFVSFALNPQPDKLTASLPPDYVGAESVRIECYRRLNRMTSLDELAEYTEELADRFGPLVASAETLLGITRLRLLAEKANIRAVRVQDGCVYLDTERGLWKDQRGKFPRLTSADPGVQLRQLESLLAELAGT